MPSIRQVLTEVGLRPQGLFGCLDGSVGVAELRSPDSCQEACEVSLKRGVLWGFAAAPSKNSWAWRKALAASSGRLVA